MQIFAQGGTRGGFERLRRVAEAESKAPLPVRMPGGGHLRVEKLGDGILFRQDVDDGEARRTLAAWVLLPSMDRPASISVDLIDAPMWRIESSPQVLRARLRKVKWTDETIEKMSGRDSLLGFALSGRRTPNEVEARALNCLFAEHA